MVELAVMEGHDDSVVAIATSKGTVTLEVLAELVELAIGDVQGCLKDGPLDTLSAWWSREGALIRPEGICAETGSQCLHIDLGLTCFWLVSCFKCFEDLIKESVILVGIHGVEKHSKDGDLIAIRSLCFVFTPEMHEMELCGVTMTFNGML